MMPRGSPKVPEEYCKKVGEPLSTSKLSKSRFALESIVSVAPQGSRFGSGSSEVRLLSICREASVLKPKAGAESFIMACRRGKERFSKKGWGRYVGTGMHPA